MAPRATTGAGRTLWQMWWEWRWECGASPTTPITITLHANYYAQLSEDADIVAALEAKNTALEGTGGSISLVSA